MAIVKIRLNTWSRENTSALKFKRSIAPREGFIEICPQTKKIILKNGEYKCKPWDTGSSKRKDQAYINYRKDLYSGLCFKSKTQAQEFMNKHKRELDILASTNPLFDHWSIMNVIERFKPNKVLIYDTDIKEDDNE